MDTVTGITPNGTAASDQNLVAPPTPAARLVEASRSTVYVSGRATRVLRLDPKRPETHTAPAPLVWLHGWGISPVPYLPALVDFAAATGRSVHALALPGFGGSDALHLRQQALSGVANHLASVIEALGLAEDSTTGRVDLAGHSFGGGISLRIGANRPDLIGSLSLYCPVGGAGDGALPLPKVIAALGSDSLHRWAPALVASALPNLRHHPVAVAASALSAWRANLLADVARVSAHGLPTVFSFGDRDGVVTPGPIAATVAPGVRVETVEGKHSWMLTDPARFAVTLREHLDSHDTSMRPTPSAA